MDAIDHPSARPPTVAEISGLVNLFARGDARVIVNADAASLREVQDVLGGALRLAAISRQAGPGEAPGSSRWANKALCALCVTLGIALVLVTYV